MSDERERDRITERESERESEREVIRLVKDWTTYTQYHTPTGTESSIIVIKAITNALNDDQHDVK